MPGRCKRFFMYTVPATSLGPLNLLAGRHDIKGLEPEADSSSSSRLIIRRLPPHSVIVLLPNDGKDSSSFMDTEWTLPMAVRCPEGHCLLPLVLLRTEV